MERQYSDKYVAFIDILGFKAILDKEGEDASRISRLFDTIVKCKEEILKKIRYTHKRNPIRSIKEAYAKEKDDADLFQCYDAALDDMVIKVVSDSIILAVPAKDDFGFTVIVDACSYIAQQLLDFEDGYFVRGAIVRGQMYFEDENVFFGEAYIKAYTLEEHSCLYPRIIYDYYNWDDYPYADSFGRTYTSSDDDGWGDICYVANYLGIRDDCWLEQREKRLIGIIEREISSNPTNPEVCAKYRWVKTQIERAHEYVLVRQSL